MPKKKENVRPEDMPYIYERVVTKHGGLQLFKKLLQFVLWAALFGCFAGGGLLFMTQFRPKEPMVMSVDSNAADESVQASGRPEASPFDVYDQTRDSFVAVSVHYGDDSWMGDVPSATGISETFAVIIAESPDKYYMLTSAEILEMAEEISVRAEDSWIEADTESVNQTEDMAVISVEKDEIPEGVSWQIATIGNSNELKTGDTVIAAGSPYGLPGSVNYGHIIYIGTEECCDRSRRMVCTNMTSAAESHGVLLDQNGRIAAWILESQNDGLADMICGAAIEELYEMIIRMADGEEMAYLGVGGQEITAAISEAHEVPEGFYITMIAEDSPAEYAGLQPGDFMISFGNQPVRNSNELRILLAEMEVEDSVTIELKRLVQDSYETMTVEAVLEKR